MFIRSYHSRGVDIFEISSMLDVINALQILSLMAIL